MKNLFLFAVLVLFPTASWAQASNPALQRISDLAYNAQFDEALRAANAYIASHPSDPLGYLFRGTATDWKRKVLVMDSQLNEPVIEDYKHANLMAFQQWEKDPENLDRMINLGNTYLFLANKWINMDKPMRAGLILKKAQKHMQEAYKKDPTRYDTQLGMGIFNYYAGNLPSGLKFFAGILGISGDDAVGIKQLTTAATQPNLYQPDAQFVMAHTYAKSKKNFAMSKKYLDMMTSKYPQNPYLRYVRGEFANVTNQYAATRIEAQQYFDFCKKTNVPCHEKYNFYSNWYLLRSYAEQKNYIPAKPYLEKLQEFKTSYNKDITGALPYYRGMVAKAEGNKKKAIAEFNDMVARQSDNPGMATRAEQELKELGAN